MKIMVTGGAGFIGSHVVQALLAGGDTVAVIDDFSTGTRQNLESVARAVGRTPVVYEADVSAAAGARAVLAERPEVLLLLAAQPSVSVSMRDPLLDARTNVTGLLNMLEAARSVDCRKVVFASSGGTIYGPVEPDDLPISERHQRNPLSFYGLSKAAAVDYLRIYCAHHGLDHACLALGNVYGPRQSPFGEAGVISIFARRLLDGDPCLINGDGLTTRDYVHVSDVTSAFVSAIHRGSGLINIGTGQQTSVLDIHRLLARQLDIRAEPRFGPAMPGEVRHISLDPALALRSLGWKPTWPLAAGIGTVLDWMTGADGHLHLPRAVERLHG